MKLIEAMKQFELSLYGEVNTKTQRWYIWFDDQDKPHGMLSSLVEAYGYKDVTMITTIDLRKWRQTVFELKTLYGNQRPAIKKELSVFSKHGYIRALRRFFNWLSDESYLEENPAALIKFPKVPDADPKAIEIETVEALLKAADKPRDKAIILFLADTGCRVAGMCGLKLTNLWLKEGKALVWEKGKGGNGKSRWIFFKTRTRIALQDYLAVRPVSDSSNLFLSLANRKPLQEGGVNQMLSRLVKRTDLEVSVNPHSFRHAAARNWLLNGADLATVSQLLGHSNIHVTNQFYARWTQDELQQWHKRISPYS